MKWFNGKGEDEEKYSAGRDLESLTNLCVLFDIPWLVISCPRSITRKTGVKSNIAGPPPTDVTILDRNNFDEVVLDKSKNVLVSFTVRSTYCFRVRLCSP